MTVRTAESVLHELDYWKAILEDICEVSDLITEASDPLPRVGNVAMALVLGDRDGQLDAVSVIQEALIASMRALLKADEGFNRILLLIEGRQLALEQEGVG